MYVEYDTRSPRAFVTKGLHLLDRAQFGPVIVSRILAPTPGAKSPSNFISFGEAAIACIVMQGSVEVAMTGLGVCVDAGELLIFDLKQLAGFTVTEDFKAVVIRTPWSMIRASPTDIHQLSRRPIDARAGVPSVLHATTAQSYRSHSAISDSNNERLGNSLTALLQVVIDEHLERDDADDEPRSTLVHTALRYIDGNVWDPKLSPASIASALNVSVRALHQSFETQPFTVARTIAIRRLSGARSDLENDAGAALSVGSVGSRWGFTSASHFSRAFKEAFGQSPSEWQKTHRDASIPGTHLTAVNNPEKLIRSADQAISA